MHPRPSPRSPFSPYTRSLRLQPEHAFLRAHGIRAQTARLFEAGWWPLAGFLDGCIGVRLHDPQGQPLGYAGRRVSPDEARRFGKWKLPRGLPKADLLFNWHRARLQLGIGVVVVEGPFDAMRVWQAGCPFVVALLGSHPSLAQQALLSGVRKVGVLLDGDDAGREGARRIALALAPRPVQVLALPEGRDPADLDEEALRRVLASFLS